MATCPDVPSWGFEMGRESASTLDQAAEALKRLTKDRLGTLMVSALKYCFRKKVTPFFLSLHHRPSTSLPHLFSFLREVSLVPSMS